MRRFGLALCLALCALVAPAAAQAWSYGTTLVMPDGRAKAMYSQWIADSLVPTAPVAVVVETRDECAESPGRPCTYFNRRPMLLQVPDDSYLWDDNGGYSEEDRNRIRLNFMHEIGHVRDYSFAHHAYRQKFMRIMGITGIPDALGHAGSPNWRIAWQGPNALQHANAVQPAEEFAMAYTYCTLFPQRPADVMRYYAGYHYLPTDAQYAEVCDLMRHLGGH